MAAADGVSTFADLGVSAEVVESLQEQGITEAFPIQVATIEATLTGRDICGKAPTGSGKTLAFGVPVVELTAKGTAWRPRALILAPTRELATQIKEELLPLAKARQRSILTVFGGTNIERDIRKLEKGVDILVACPGRLEDLIARRCCELRNIDIVVVDEADRMADMGFLPSVKRLLDQTAADRHTLLFSATLDGDVNMLIERYQKDPLRFEVEEQVGDIGDVEHSWYLVQPNDRIGSAVAVLRSYYSSIVFCRTRRGCDRVAKTFAARGLAAVAIHGDRSQGQRERALKDFTSGKAQVLVATDVAARGIHVDNVALVMHYDPAGSDKDYIHRSGRTGRAGQDGRVISMVVEDKKKVARQLQKELGFKPGFEDLDIDALPAPVARPKPKPETRPKPTVEDEPSSQRGDGRRKSHDDNRDRDDRDGRRKTRSNNRERGARGKSRDRDERGARGKSRDRDDRGARGKSRDRDDRGARGKSRDRDDRGARGKSRDRDDRDDRGKSRDRDDRGSDGRGKGRGGDQRRSSRRKSGNDWYPPGYHDDDKRGGSRSSSSGRSKKDAGSSRAREEDVSPGGSGTEQRKSRAAKGRHADKGGAKNKGKRRTPRSR